MTLPFIDRIWHVRGSVALAPGQSPDDAFDRLEPLMRERGTSHERTGDTLTFRKKDASAQDKLSVFDQGALQIEQGVTGPVLRYDLRSRTLLFCFFLPLLFVGIAQLTVVLAKPEEPTADAAKKAGKAADAKKKPDAIVPQNPIDKFLGAPAPEKPKKDADKPGRRSKKASKTPAYVFAAIFATLYVAGRILEDWLVRRLFRKRLLGA